MAHNDSVRRYRLWYSKLLRLYPRAFRERFAEGMEQTFNDLCRERAAANRGLFGFALWICLETSAGIVRENLAFMMKHYKNIVRIVLVVAAILMVPWLTGAPWDLFDYVIAGALLLGTGFACEFVAGKAVNTPYRVAAGLALGAALLLVWINLAVGIIGSENNPANLLYWAVLAVGFVGAVLARLRPLGMSRALLATALAQALVPVIALIIWQPKITLGVLAVFALNGIFVMLFAGSAFLFRRAIVARSN